MSPDFQVIVGAKVTAAFHVMLIQMHAATEEADAGGLFGSGR